MTTLFVSYITNPSLGEKVTKQSPQNNAQVKLTEEQIDKAKNYFNRHFKNLASEQTGYSYSFGPSYGHIFLYNLDEIKFDYEGTQVLLSKIEKEIGTDDFVILNIQLLP